MSCVRFLLLVAACALSACGTRPLLPTLSLHALWILRQNAREFGLQAQLSFRPRSQPHPRGPQGSGRPAPQPFADDCKQALLCEWAELSEESTLSALGVSP